MAGAFNDPLIMGGITGDVSKQKLRPNTFQLYGVSVTQGNNQLGSVGGMFFQYPNSYPILIATFQAHRMNYDNTTVILTDMYGTVVMTMNLQPGQWIQQLETA
jgi:hypothetical protein